MLQAPVGDQYKTMILSGDVMNSSKPFIEQVLQAGVPVLGYNGAWDGASIDLACPMPGVDRACPSHIGVVGAAVSEPLYAALEWDGNEAFKSTPRAPWKVQATDTEVAGFVSEIRVGASRFARAVVRRAGHILPADNPAAAFDMIDRFILGRGWE